MSENKDFVMVPRRLRELYLAGSITKNEFDVLVWIWLGTNPVNGYFTLSYEGLISDLRGQITYVNARKIISSLRKKQYIYFSNHKGRRGSFPVYPANFTLTKGQMQTWEYLTKRRTITTQSQAEELPSSKPENRQRASNHNFQEQKKALINKLSMSGKNPQITTPYNDDKTKTHKTIVSEKDLSELNRPTSSFKERIPVQGFSPKTWEEEKCWQIAKELGEVDMRFLLSCLKKYGFREVERVWGLFRDTPKGEIQNERAFFNSFIRKNGEQIA